MGSKDKKSSSSKSKSKRHSEKSTSKKPDSIRIGSVSEKDIDPYTLVPIGDKYDAMYKLVYGKDTKYFNTAENVYLYSSGIQVYKEGSILTPEQDKYDLTKPHPDYKDFSNEVSDGKISITINEATQEFYEQYLRFMEKVKDVICQQALVLKEEGKMKKFFKGLDISEPGDVERFISYPTIKKDVSLLPWSLSNFVNLVDTNDPDNHKAIDKECLIGKRFKAWYVFEVNVTFFSDDNNKAKIYIKPVISTAYINKRSAKVAEYNYVDE